MAVIDTTLRQLAGRLIADYPQVTGVAGIGRIHIEAYKQWLVARPGYRKQTTLSKTTLGMRMGHLRVFFERIAEWGYDDVPIRIPVYASDRPFKNKPLPKFLDDPTAAKFMAAARALPDPFDRLAIELLARTGMRKGELLGLTIDAVVQIGSAYWLRTPVGKLHNDRYIPLHPACKSMIDDWLARPAGLAGQPSAAHRPGPARPAVSRGQGRPTRRDRRRHRARPPPPAAPHPGHPGHQPGHEPGSHRRAARAQDHDDDDGLRPHRRPHRRTGVLLSHREGRSPLPRPQQSDPARRRRR